MGGEWRTKREGDKVREKWWGIQSEGERDNKSRRDRESEV
jgi:hypothetical protein